MELPSASARSAPELCDVTLRHTTARVLESENFTAELFEETSEFLQAMDEAVEKILTESDNR